MGQAKGESRTAFASSSIGGRQKAQPLAYCAWKPRIAILREIGHEPKPVETLQDAPELASKTQGAKARLSNTGDAGSRRRRGAA